LLGVDVRPTLKAVHILIQTLLVSAVVMGAAHTVARERLFEPLRRQLGGKETWLGYLVSCPYCVSHWIAFLLVPVTQTYPLQVTRHWGIASTILTWFLSSLLVAVVASFLRILFYVADEKQSLLRTTEHAVRKGRTAPKIDASGSDAPSYGA
jgi:hypothetical protein